MDSKMLHDHGGLLVGSVLRAHGVKVLFGLCGGHISPIFIGAKAKGIRVVDVRHEATAVYAADAVARLTGIPGVAVVTAGPGLTNTITAVKNAQLARSPVLVLAGATATLLKGKGSLQDIDQLALMRPHVKWHATVKTVREIVPVLNAAFARARSGIPGPVFIEIPMDLQYPEDVVRELYGSGLGNSRSLGGRLQRWYVARHVNKLFAGKDLQTETTPRPPTHPLHTAEQVARAARIIAKADRPVLIVGSGAMMLPEEVASLRQAVEEMGIPTYLSGMARGLLGKDNRLHLRHGRAKALKAADLVLTAGVPFDFRLGYGKGIPPSSTVIAVSRSSTDLRKNRKPTLGVEADPSEFLRAVAGRINGKDAWEPWLESCRRRDRKREGEMRDMASETTDHVNPLWACHKIDEAAEENSVFIGDGGDFVATASYIVRPRAPLSWLDPGVFGTLGAGAGFALGAKLCRPDAEVWLLYGDGAAGYSLMEFDTFVRHRLPVIGVIGNDACWTQIAREQVEIFRDGLATDLAPSDYQAVVRALGAAGLKVEHARELPDALAEATKSAAMGTPTLVNVLIGRTELRKGSISM